MGKIWAGIIAILTFLGMPLFAVMGAISILCWLTHDREELRSVRYIAPNVLEDRFVASPILVTIPLFTFAGYLMAESKTPDRIVRASSAVLGWLPGGLAIVCIVASAFFTTMTGGSGVTIVAVGGFLYPALVRQGYPKDFALGLVTSAGAIGLLFFPSPLVMVYGFVAGVDVNYAYLATLFPAIGLLVCLCLYGVYIGRKYKVPISKFEPREAGRAIWAVKWELFIPLVVLSGLGTGLMELDESAAAAALYVLFIEVFIYKDLDFKKVLKVAKDGMSLAGALILILAMATSMTNYIIQERIPQDILDFFIAKGMNQPWHFILALNIFLFILGMLMDAFSALLVALPLLIPLAATFNIHPFHLAVMFLLNMELAYIMPPAGLNLFISSFRFNRPVIQVYRVVIPFVILLHIGLILLIVVPKFSSFTVDGVVAQKKLDAERDGVAPREAWLLECIQEDKLNPRPCTQADKDKYGIDGLFLPGADKADEDAPVKQTAAEQAKQKKDEDDLFAEMMGDGSATPSASASAPPPDSSAPIDSAAPDTPPAPTETATAAPGGDSPPPDATGDPDAGKKKKKKKK